jgi:hypothetical protein
MGRKETLATETCVEVQRLGNILFILLLKSSQQKMPHAM